MHLSIVEEYQLSSSQKEQIQSLLFASFENASEFRDRIYFKQIPTRRVLALGGEKVLGQLGLVHRVIGTEEGPVTIFGILDVCVHAEHRGQGYALSMLSLAESMARSAGIDFLMLFATDKRLYEKTGFMQASNVLRWMKLHEHKTLGIAEEAVDELMIKELGERRWPTSTIDLMGHLF